MALAVSGTYEEPKIPAAIFFLIIIPYLNEFSLLLKLQVRNEIRAVVLQHYYRTNNKLSSYPQYFREQVLQTHQPVVIH